MHKKYINYKDITFLLTLYNPEESDLKKWNSYFERFDKEGVEYFVIVDNPLINVDDFFKRKNSIHYNKKNIGKFNSIFNFVRGDKVKTSHIKVCDPDDEINIEEFLNFKTNNTGIIRMISKKIENEIHINERRKSLGNSWTILPVNGIKKDTYYNDVDGEIFNWLEDQSLGIISYINGEKIHNTNYGWYYYIQGSGMTSNFTTESYFEIISTLKILLKILRNSNSKPKTNFPGKGLYLIRLINESNLPTFKKQEYIKNLKSLLKLFK